MGLRDSETLPEPGCENECSHSWLTVVAEFGAHRIHYVAGEERHPADQENSCKWEIRDFRYRRGWTESMPHVGRLRGIIFGWLGFS